MGAKGAGADFINRIDDQQYLLNVLNLRAQEKKILILHSPSGIGKSYLVDRVIPQLTGQFHYATIGRATKYDGATYIQQIAGTLNDRAKEAGSFPTISQFRHLLKHEDTGATLKLIGAAVEPIGQAVMAAPTPTSLAKAFEVLRGVQSYFMVTDSPEQEIVSSRSCDAIKFCERYTRYVVGKNDVILRINGYDAIDDESDFYLRSLYGDARNLTLILEITERTEGGDSVATHLDIGERFPGGHIDYRKVASVDAKHVVEYYEQILSHEVFNVPKFIEDAFTSSKGNFRRFEFLLRDKIARPLSENFASSEERILTLVNEMPQNCKRLLALVTVISTRLSFRSVEEIWSSNNWSTAGDLPSTIGQLQADFGSLISVEGDAPVLAVEFARDYLLQCPQLAIFHAEARRVLLAQLRQENLSCKSADRTYSNLLCIISLVIQGGGSGDASLLPSSLRDLDLNQYPPNKTELAANLRTLFFEYVHKGRQAATDRGRVQEFDRVYEEICKILYRTGEIDLLEKIAGAYFEFLPLEKHNDLLRLTVISARILNSREDALADLEAIDKGNLQLYVGSRLLLILYYRTFGFLRKAKREWRRLRGEAKTGQIPFEGLLYEYGALTRPFNIVSRIRFLKQAKAHHLANNNNFHAVTCSLGIAGTYFHIPLFRKLKLNMARKELATTSHLLPSVRVMDHILENHAAIAQVLGGARQSGIVEKLMFAYDRCALKADKVIIGANLIDCYVDLRRHEIAVPGIAAYAKEVVELARIYQNRNGEFALYALSACCRYYAFMDDRRMSRELEELDMRNMPIQLSFHNLGRPQTGIAKLFVRWIYSRLYRLLWPKVQPVFNWTADFYSFQQNS